MIVNEGLGALQLLLGLSERRRTPGNDEFITRRVEMTFR
jgi:hypothetical protein